MNKETFNSFLKNSKKGHDILGRDQIGNYAVMVSLVELDGDYHFLFQKRAKGIRQGSEISFPGGRFDTELDVTFKDTAIRETCEELGITEDQIDVVARVDTFVSHAYIENYLGFLKIKSLEDLDINKDEVEFVFTIPIDYFLETDPEVYGIKVRSFSSEIDEDGHLIEYFPVKELDLPKRYHHTWNDGFRNVYVYRTKYGTLWGITALIVYETVNKYLKNIIE